MVSGLFSFAGPAERAVQIIVGIAQKGTALVGLDWGGSWVARESDREI